MSAAVTGSPWVERRAAAPLHAWSAAQAEAIRAAFEGVCNGWAADWGMPTAEGSLARFGEAPSGNRWTAHGPGLWLAAALDAPRVVEAKLLGDGATPVSAEVLEACRQDLRDRLLGAFGTGDPGVRVDALPSRLAESWSGALLLRHGEAALAAADAQALRRLAGIAPAGSLAGNQSERLSDVAEALADAAISFNLELGACELPADDLLGLRPGDVIRLSHPLDRPARVRDEDGSDCFAGHLRRRAGWRAVELGAVPTAEQSSDQGEDGHGH